MSTTTAVVNPETENNDFILAATAIFGGSSNSFISKTLKKPVAIKPASMKHMPHVMRFFTAVLKNLDHHALTDLVVRIIDKQKQAVDQGQDPNKIDLTTIQPEQLMGKALGNVSLLAQLLTAASDEMPALAEAFTNISEEEYGELPLDEGMLIAVGIFTCNYSFFSRSLPPIFAAFMKSRASLVPASEEKAVANRPIKRRR